MPRQATFARSESSLADAITRCSVKFAKCIPARNAEPRAGGGGDVSADFSSAGEPSGPGVSPGVRASDADRDRVVDVLCAAAGDGRLTADEFDERLEAALSSRTLDELAVLTADLTGGPGRSSVATAQAEDVMRINKHGGLGPVHRPLGGSAAAGAAVLVVRCGARLRQCGDHARHGPY